MKFLTNDAIDECGSGGSQHGNFDAVAIFVVVDADLLVGAMEAGDELTAICVRDTNFHSLFTKIHPIVLFREERVESIVMVGSGTNPSVSIRATDEADGDGFLIDVIVVAGGHDWTLIQRVLKGGRD